MNFEATTQASFDVHRGNKFRLSGTIVSLFIDYGNAKPCALTLEIVSTWRCVTSSLPFSLPASISFSTFIRRSTKRNKWILKQFLAQDAVELGRLVFNVEYPKQDFYSPYPLSPSKESIALLRFRSFHDSLECSQFHTFLMRLVSMFFGA